MKNQKLFNQLNEIIDNYNVYKNSISVLQIMLTSKINFRFAIKFIPSQGFMILKIDTLDLALLKDCLIHLETHSFLSESDFNKMTI